MATAIQLINKNPGNCGKNTGLTNSWSLASADSWRFSVACDLRGGLYVPIVILLLLFIATLLTPQMEPLILKRCTTSEKPFS